MLFRRERRMRSEEDTRRRHQASWPLFSQNSSVDAATDDRAALMQQQYEMRPAPVRNTLGGGLYEADATAKSHVHEVPDNAR